MRAAIRAAMAIGTLVGSGALAIYTPVAVFDEDSPKTTTTTSPTEVLGSMTTQPQTIRIVIEVVPGSTTTTAVPNEAPPTTAPELPVAPPTTTTTVPLPTIPATTTTTIPDVPTPVSDIVDILIGDARAASHARPGSATAEDRRSSRSNPRSVGAASRGGD